MARRTLVLAAVLGGLAVLTGAFGAHGLRERLSPEALAWWKTAVEYHLAHALALLVTGLLAERAPSRALAVAAVAFAVGVLLFSGSLYALAWTGVRALGAVTPFGGLAFLVGWGALAVAAARRRPA